MKKLKFLDKVVSEMDRYKILNVNTPQIVTVVAVVVCRINGAEKICWR